MHTEPGVVVGGSVGMPGASRSGVELSVAWYRVDWGRGDMIQVEQFAEKAGPNYHSMREKGCPCWDCTWDSSALLV